MVWFLHQILLLEKNWDEERGLRCTGTWSQPPMWAKCRRGLCYTAGTQPVDSAVWVLIPLPLCAGCHFSPYLMLRLSPALVDMTTSVSGMAICQGLEQFQRDLGSKGPVNLHCSSSFTMVTCKFLIAEAGVLSGLILDLTLCLFTKGSYLLREESSCSMFPLCFPGCSRSPKNFQMAYVYRLICLSISALM